MIGGLQRSIRKYGKQNRPFPSSPPVQTYAQSESSGMDLRVAMMQKNDRVAAEYEQINQLATRLGDKLPGTTADFKNLMTMLIRQGM